VRVVPATTELYDARVIWGLVVKATKKGALGLSVDINQSHLLGLPYIFPRGRGS
jgi:hypothetical protein